MQICVEPDNKRLQLMTCSAAGEKILGYTTVYTKKLYLFEAPQANFFGLMTQAPTFSHDSPPVRRGIQRGVFHEKTGFRGDWGDFWVFCRR